MLLFGERRLRTGVPADDLNIQGRSSSSGRHLEIGVELGTVDLGGSYKQSDAP
tara:strand:- start:636 stop:794 length:159 start_codon:yes stop_codon:yes gene_type:complete